MAKSEVIRVDKSPMNPARKRVELSCGHEVWVNRAPQVGTKIVCEKCTAKPATGRRDYKDLEFWTLMRILESHWERKDMPQVEAVEEQLLELCNRPEPRPDTSAELEGLLDELDLASRAFGSDENRDLKTGREIKARIDQSKAKIRDLFQRHEGRGENEISRPRA